MISYSLPSSSLKLVFLFRLAVFTTLEFFRPARAISYLSVIWRDLVAYGFFRCAILPVTPYLNGIFPGYHPAPASVARLPLGERVLLYFILADFGHYWIHRLAHTRYFWRVHKWHHAPTYMYWLGGVRTTVPDFFLVNIPYILTYAVLDISPWWMASAMAVWSMNVTWRSRWLEWILVTPRYHHIHHSDNPEHYGRNLTSLLYGTASSGPTSIRKRWMQSSPSASGRRKIRFASCWEFSRAAMCAPLPSFYRVVLFSIAYDVTLYGVALFSLGYGQKKKRQGLAPCLFPALLFFFYYN